MINLNQVHSLTTNFSSYQGLKGIPLGLLLMILSLWASAQAGPGPALYFPVGISIVFVYLYWIVNRFYARVYGVVVPDNNQKIISRVREISLGIGALLAFWVDVSFSPAFSTLGLVFASALLVDYSRVAGKSGDRLLLFYPIAALLITILSLIPVLNVNWWEPLGIKALLLAVCATAGLLFIILGVITHISFENLLLSNVFEELTKLDRLIHEPARLAILTALHACQETDFLFLRRLTALSAGNLSVHLSKLEDAELLRIEKKIIAKRTHTHISITTKGSEAINNYWHKIESLRNEVDNWEMDE
jgi:DNA-binding transcriptional ArsR family regulator